MNKDTEKILNGLKNKKIGVFIDNSNLFYAQKKVGWKIDYKKLKKFLSSYIKIEIFNFYAAVPKKSDPAHKATLKYLNLIERFAKLRLKPLKYIKSGDKIIKKGDVDLEIVIDVVRNINNLDVVIVASGDSDYLELKEWVTKDCHKKMVFMSFENNTAWEIRLCLHLYINRLKEILKFKPT